MQEQQKSLGRAAGTVVVEEQLPASRMHLFDVLLHISPLNAGSCVHGVTGLDSLPRRLGNWRTLGMLHVKSLSGLISKAPKPLAFSSLHTAARNVFSFQQSSPEYFPERACFSAEQP